MFDKVGYKSVREIINYFKNTLGINRDMQKYVQTIIKTFAERIDAQGEDLLRSLERALTTVSTADQWFADPQFKSETILLLERLNNFPEDPEIKDMLKFTKEILQSVRDGLGRNDGEFMVNLSEALSTVSDFKGIINIIREYLTPTRVSYFGNASVIAAQVLTYIISSYTSSSNEDFNILKAQLVVQLQIGRILTGLYLISRTHIRLEIQRLQAQFPNDYVQLQNMEILDQMERECMQYLEHVAPLSPVLLHVIQGIQIRIEEEMKKNRKLTELTPTVLLDRINCFTHGEILLQGLYENTLTISLISSRSFLTWKYLYSIYEQNDKLVVVLQKFTKEIKKSFCELIDIITKTQTDVQFSLWQALTVIYSEEECDYDLYFPAISSELAAVHRHYREELNEAHVRGLLRTEQYTGLSEDNGLYDLLINLLRKRAFFQVSYELFCSLRFPNNIPTEIKIGALDVYNTIIHPIDTIKNIVCFPYLFLRHLKETPRQIGTFIWNRPIRVLASTAISGVIVGGANAISKMSTATGVANNSGMLTNLECGWNPPKLAHTFRPEGYQMMQSNIFKGVATAASVADSPISTTVLARTGAAMNINAAVTCLRQSNFKLKEDILSNGDKFCQIASIFQEVDRHVISMNSKTFFKMIDQVILDNKDEIKDILSYTIN